MGIPEMGIPTMACHNPQKNKLYIAQHKVVSFMVQSSWVIKQLRTGELLPVGRTIQFLDVSHQSCVYSSNHSNWKYMEYMCM